LWAQAASVRRARVAAEFGQVSAEMQSTMERAHLLPLHDLRADARVVEKRLHEIESRLGELGAFAEGPGRYALGRGHLALYDYEPARRELERAWQAGEHRPEVALALGEALGELYQVKRDEAVRHPEPERSARLEAAKKQYRDPALARLRAATGGESAYVEGLIALYEERFEDALSRATEAAKRDPWFYPAERLQAQAMRWIGNAKGVAGDYDGARAELEKTGPILDHALQIGRSDPQLLEAACARYLQEMRVERRRNGPLQPLLEGVQRRCGEARIADADRVEGWVQEAGALDIFGEWQNYQGQDALPTTAREIELAEKALTLDPNNMNALGVHGGAWENRADWEMTHGVDPIPSLKKALADYDRMVAIDPNSSDSIMGEGRVYGKMAQLDSAAGRDAGPNLEKAVAQYRLTVEKWPQFFVGWDNLGVAEYVRGADQFARGQDPTEALQSSLHDFAQSLANNPRSTNAALNSSADHESLAELAIARGGDPEPEIAEAEKAAQKALGLYPDMSLAHEDLGEARYLRASWQFDEGRDASAMVDAAREASLRSVKSDPACLLCWVEVGKAEILAARIALKEKRSPAAAFSEAERQIGQALKLDPKFEQAWVTAAWMHRWRAAWKPAATDSEVSAGLDAVRRALEANPNDAEAHFAAGALHLAAGNKDKARQELDRALQINRWLERRIRPFSEEAKAP
jgi:serine/threonine-protein kinase